MLYELWCKVAKRQWDHLAVHDLGSGQRWTFGDLFRAGEAIQPDENNFAFPQGQPTDFVLTILAAWRTGKVVCPLERGQPPPVTGAKTPPSGIVHLKTTSATTGAARLVAFTAEQLVADAENIVSTMGLRTDWPNLGVISLAHSYGFSNLMMPLLIHGIPLIAVTSPLPEAVRQAAQGVSALTLPAVPALWRAWHEADAIPPNVQLAISAGAPLPLALEQEVFAKRRLKIHNFYGASECGGIAYDTSETAREEAAYVGAPIKNVCLSVADDGCMQVRGRAVAETYWPRPHSSLGCGCFHTSDLAEITNGQVYLRGRAGDQINVAGRKVSPETIEGVLLEHPAVSACLVFGVPSRDAKRTEEIVAVLVSRAPEETLRQFTLQVLPAWQAPRHWWFVEALTPNARGKLSRAGWRTEFMCRSK